MAVHVVDTVLESKVPRAADGSRGNRTAS